MEISAINLLQELTIKKGSLPNYEFSSTSNSCEFNCTCIFKQWKAHGTGRRKKEAKSNAAKNMLTLLNTNNEISQPKNTLSSSLMKNVNQNPIMVNKTPLSYDQPPIFHNYVGILNEFCQQQNINDLNYEHIDTSPVSPLSSVFKIKVSISSGLFNEVGIGQCKKSAKQDAAKKMLECMGIDMKNNNKTKETDIEMLKKIIQDLDVKILDSVSKEKIEEDKKAEEIAKKGESLYLECKKKVSHETKTCQIRNIHFLFEKNYSTKISHDLKEKMQIIRRKGYVDQSDFNHIKKSVKNEFQVMIQEKKIFGDSDKCLLCMQLLSNPLITQIGMGETILIAKCNAMYKLILTILLFLNI